MRRRAARGRAELIPAAEPGRAKMSMLHRHDDLRLLVGRFKALQLRCRDLRGQRGRGRMRIRKRGVFLKPGNKLRVCISNVRHGCGILTGLLSLSAQKAQAEFLLPCAQLSIDHPFGHARCIKQYLR